MAFQSPALSEQDLFETYTLLDSLYSFGKKPADDPKLAKLLRHTDHDISTLVHSTASTSSTIPKDPDYDAEKITSWKMQDYAYKRDPCPYPTRARGLFTQGRQRIVARAYDKFFNVDEVSWTKWSKLPELTTAPYYLTLKSNGCLILISALSPTELLITSKHSIGQAKADGGMEFSHAQMGERWLDAGLAKVGKKREDLASRLWQENWTCVAELCDDSFEEHILPYSKETSGLHLHGLVYNHPTLLTLPPPEVSAIANEYGFVETLFITLNSVKEVKDFTDSIAADDGRWNGQHVEGFVVRANLKPGSIEKQPQPNDARSMEDPRRVFMWKVKFDQPYLMWREWRETTKKILSQKKKDGVDVAQLGRAKLARQDSTSSNGGSNGAIDVEAIDNGMRDLKTNSENSGLPSTIRADKFRNPETRLYATWVQAFMGTNPEYFIGYQENKGIIAVREAFLRWKQETGQDQPQIASANGGQGGQEMAGETVFEKTLIVPVAVPGCGKTLVGVALSHLFGIARTESDDVKEKKAAKHFESRVSALLKDNKIVYADRNNHLKQHREALVELSSQKKCQSAVRRIAIVWSLTNLPQNEIHRICSDRIVGRGENHQSLRPVKTGEHELILMRFFSTAEEFDPAFGADGEFDHVIEMTISWDFEHSLHVLVDELVRVIPELHAPSEAETTNAIAQTQEYKPAIYKEMKLDGLDRNSSGGKKGIRYYGIAVEVDLPSLLEKYFADTTDVTASCDRALFDRLKSSNRIEKKPHVTLIHENELQGVEPDTHEGALVHTLWKQCKALAERCGDESVPVKVTLGPLLVWDTRAMSIQVSDLAFEGIKEEEKPSDHRKDAYHITVGTKEQDIRPIEGRWLLEDALKGLETSRSGEKIQKAQLDELVVVKGRMRGLF